MTPASTEKSNDSDKTVEHGAKVAIYDRPAAADRPRWLPALGWVGAVVVAVALGWWAFART